MDEASANVFGGEQDDEDSDRDGDNNDDEDEELDERNDFDPTEAKAPQQLPVQTFDRIWTFDRDASLPDSASAVVRHDLHADFVAYTHASFNSKSNIYISSSFDSSFDSSPPLFIYPK